MGVVLILLLANWLVLKRKGVGFNVLLGSSLLLGILYLVAGFTATAFLAGFSSGIFALVAGFNWEPATSPNPLFILEGIYTTLNKVLIDVFLFQGALLYILISLLGEKRGNLLSALVFSIYSWVVTGLLGNPVMILWTLVYAGLLGTMYAYAYSRTGSVALPVGLHWGLTFTDQVLFDFDSLSLFNATLTIKTRYLSTLEEIVYLQLPIIAFAVIVVVLLRQHTALKIRTYRV